MPEMRNRKDGAGPVKSLHQSLHGGGHLKPHKVERLDEAIDKSGGKSSKGTHLSMSGGKDEATDMHMPSVKQYKKVAKAGKNMPKRKKNK